MENNLAENNLKNDSKKIRLFLEASLRRKIQNEKISIINRELDDSQKKEITYKIWLHTPDALKEASQAIGRVNDYFPGKFNTTGKIVKFKLGQIDFQDLKLNSIQYNQTNSNNNKVEKYLAVLAEVQLGRMQTVLLEEGSDPEKGFFENNKLNDANNVDSFYLYRGKRPNSLDSDHWFAIKDSKRLTYLALVSFDTEDDIIKCNVCGEISGAMIYCNNDKQYFCKSCDDKYHNSANYQSIRRHKRTNYLSFSITYQGNCLIHNLKAYEFYCSQCKALYCIKCLNEGEHVAGSDHEIQYLNEIYTNIEDESKALVERVKQITAEINSDVQDREKYAKEIQKIIQAFEDSLYTRKKKAIQDVDSEVLHRCTYLASIAIEFQRILSELDSKISFIRELKNTADYATYINMTNMFTDYLKNNLFKNVDLMINNNLNGITETFHKIEKKSPSEVLKR